MKPLADTQRIVDWEELPPRAREIPDNFSPLDAGVLMAHQAEWIDLINDPDVKIAGCEKGRRTGITLATAWDDTITAGTDKAEGGDDVWYMADTREKGLEYIGYCAKFARVIARGQVSAIEQYLFEDQDADGGSRHITAYRIRFGSGNRITALASRPENVHGLQGIVNLDEAALHPNVSHTLESATALLAWGGRIRVWSTHRGKGNPFNQLIKDIRAGLYGSSARAIKITFDTAVENGLYERVCYMKGVEPTVEGKKKWYTEFRASYGPRTAAMREELDVIPRDGSGVAIPSIWVENCMPEVRPVLRVALDDDFARRPEHQRRRWAATWIETTLKPVLSTLARERQHVLGMDFARHRHFSIIMPAMISLILKRVVPFIVELHNVPTRQQEQILWAVIEGLPKFRAGAIDATGPGQTIAEYTADKFGQTKIHEVGLSRKWYAENMQTYVDAFEDGSIELPKDDNTLQDHRAVEIVDGIPMVPKIESRDLTDADLVRHGDSAVAGALMWFASNNRAAPIEYTAAPSKREQWDNTHDDDTPIRMKGGW